MQITIHVPDDMVEEIKDNLPPPESGVLEAIALDAVLGFIMNLGEPVQGRESNDARHSPLPPNPLSQLLAFLFKLQHENIHFRLECVRDSLMVCIPTPSKHYEVEFFDDGHIEVQKFGPASAVEITGFDSIVEAVLTDTVGDERKPPVVAEPDPSRRS
jgi:hypothetical protein